MKLTAGTIVRNEEALIAKHIAHLSTLGDEVLVIVQPSTDATLMFAQDCARRCLKKDVRVIEHTPEQMGWEFSLKKFCEESNTDWNFLLTADETYCGVDLKRAASLAKKHNMRAAAIRRWHAVAANKNEWFKVEQYKPELRLFNRLAKTSAGGSLMDFDFALHRGLNHAFNGKAVTLPQNTSVILEYKPAWMHAKGQYFCSDSGVLNDLAQCETMMSPADLRLGHTFYERMKG